MLSGGPSTNISPSIAPAFPIRFVSSSQSRFDVFRITVARSSRHSRSTALSNTSARLAQNTRCRASLVSVPEHRPHTAPLLSPRHPQSLHCTNQQALAFQRIGLRQLDVLVRRRGAPGPQLTATPPPKRALRVSA